MGLLSRSRHSGKELNSLSSGSENELIQLIDRLLDGSDHILQPLSAGHEFSQVGVVINSDGHRLFSRTMFSDLLSMEVVQVLLTTLFLDRIGGNWWQVGVLRVRPGLFAISDYGDELVVAGNKISGNLGGGPPSRAKIFTVETRQHRE